MDDGTLPEDDISSPTRLESDLTNIGANVVSSVGESPLEVMSQMPTRRQKLGVRFSSPTTTYDDEDFDDEATSEPDYGIEQQIEKIKIREQQKESTRAAARRRERGRKRELAEHIDGMLETEREIRKRGAEEAKRERLKATKATLESHGEERHRITESRAIEAKVGVQKFLRDINERRGTMQNSHKLMKDKKLAELSAEREASGKERDNMRHRIEETNKLQRKRKEKVDDAMVLFYTERRTRMDEERAADDEASKQYSKSVEEWNQNRQTEQKQMGEEIRKSYKDSQKQIDKRVSDKRDEREAMRAEKARISKEKRAQALQNHADKKKQQETSSNAQKASHGEDINSTIVLRRKAREEEQEEHLSRNLEKWKEMDNRKRQLCRENSERKQKEIEDFEKKVAADRARLEGQVRTKKEEETAFWDRVLTKQAEMKAAAMQRREQEVMAMVFRERLIKERVDEIRQEKFWRRHEQREWSSFRQLLQETCEKQINLRKEADKQRAEEQSQLTKLRKDERDERRQMENDILEAREEKSKAEATLRSEERTLKRQEKRQTCEHYKRQHAAQVKADSELCRRVWKEERRYSQDNARDLIRQQFIEETSKRDKALLKSSVVVVPQRHSQRHSTTISSQTKSATNTINEYDYDDHMEDECGKLPSWEQTAPVIPLYDSSSNTYEEVLLQQSNRREILFRKSNCCIEPAPIHSSPSTDPLCGWCCYVRCHTNSCLQSNTLIAQYRILFLSLCCVLSASYLPTSRSYPDFRSCLLKSVDILHFVCRMITGRQQLLYSSSYMIVETTGRISKFKWVVSWIPPCTEIENCDMCEVHVGLSCGDDSTGKCYSELFKTHDLKKDFSALQQEISTAVKTLCCLLIEKSIRKDSEESKPPPPPPRIVMSSIGDLAGRYVNSLAEHVSKVIHNKDIPRDNNKISVVKYSCLSKRIPSEEESQDDGLPDFTIQRVFTSDDSLLLLSENEIMSTENTNLVIAKLSSFPEGIQRCDAIDILKQTQPKSDSLILNSSNSDCISPVVLAASLDSQNTQILYLKTLLYNIKVNSTDFKQPRATGWLAHEFRKISENDNLKPKPTQILTLNPTTGDVVDESFDRIFDVLVLASDKQDFASLESIQGMHCISDGPHPEYLLLKRLLSSGMNPTTRLITRKQFSSYAKQLIWDVPYIADQVLGTFGFSFDFSSNSIKRDASKLQPTATEIQEACSSLDKNLHLPLLDCNLQITVEFNSCINMLFDSAKSPCAGGEGLTHMCFSTLLNASEFVGVPESETPLEIWMRILMAGSSKSSFELNKYFTSKSNFRQLMHQLTISDEVCMWRRLMSLGYTCRLLSTPTTLNNIHIDNKCPCLSLSKTRRKPSSVQLLQKRNNYQNKKKAKTPPENSRRNLPFNVSLEDRTLFAVNYKKLMQPQSPVLGPEILLNPMMTIAPPVDELLKQKSQNKIIQQKLQRIQELHGTPSKSPAPLKISQPATHLYHNSIARETIVENTLQKNRVSTIHDGMKRVSGCPKNLYDPDKQPKRKEEIDAPLQRIAFPPPELEPRQQKQADILIERMFKQPIIHQQQTRDALVRKYLSATEKRPGKVLSLQETQDVVSRNSETAFQIKVRNHKAAINKIIAEDKKATKIVSAAEIKTVTNRLYCKALEDEERAIEKVIARYPSSRPPAVKLSHEHISESAVRLAKGEANSNFKIPKFYKT